jgi:hypothetical protein
MPARIVIDYPHRQRTSVATRALRSLLGSLLLLLAMAATVVVVPAALVTAGDLIARFDDDPSTVMPPTIPVRAIEGAFVASVAAMWIGFRYGRRLIRGRRSAVLFLRRFGYRGSMEAVTFAVVRTIGRSWRLVTLDDEQIASVGVAPVSRVVFGLGSRVARIALGAGHFVLTSFRWTVTGAALVLAAQIAQVQLASNWSGAMRDGTFDPYLAVVFALLEGSSPVRYFAPTLPGVFALLATAVALGLAGLLVMCAAMLVAVPFSGVLMLASSSAEAMRKAEESKTRAIRHGREVTKAVTAITEQGRQTFAPRLVVLRVATEVWQQSVSELARVTSASIIDVSEPSEHLLWELDELKRMCPGRSIIIGEHTRVARWAQSDGGTPSDGSLDSRFASRLDGRDVLAYTTDRAGMRRFARALHGLLLDIDDGPSR